MEYFDSTAYPWSSLTIVRRGSIVHGVTAVKYGKKQEKDYGYGRGEDPLMILRGNKSYSGSLTLWKSELEKMEDSAPGGDILNDSFDLIVSFVPKDGGRIITRLLTSVEVSEAFDDTKQGDKNMLVEVPILFLGIKKM